MLIKKLLIAVFLASLSLFTACEKNPVNRLVNPTVSNTTGSTTWAGPWVLYDDEILTGGGIGRFTTADGQGLDFVSRENPHTGTSCIKFSWDGRDVTAYANPPDTPADYIEHNFVGFSFKVQNDNIINSPVSKDLRPGAYTYVSFYARGRLNENVAMRVVGPGTDAANFDILRQNLTADWQPFSVPVTGNLADTRNFVSFIIISSGSARSNGGTIFIDDIRLRHSND